MLKRAILSTGLLLAVCFTNAQRAEFGLNLFASQYFGDLREQVSERADFGDYLGYSMEYIRPGIGAYIRHNLNERVSFRGNINYTRLLGSDESAVVTFNRERNLSFRSTLIEFSGLVEYNLVPFEYTRSSLGGRSSAPFVFGGLALFRFNPQAEYTNPTNGSNEWVDLQPLSTEGQDIIQYAQRKRYSLTQFAVPIGVGYKWALGQNWRMSLELGHRFTFTDYIDDVSTTYVSNDIILANRGETAAALADRRREFDDSAALATEGTPRGRAGNDSYTFFGISVGYVIYKGNCPTWF